MRTYTNTSFTNRNVFGLSQDRVVVSSLGTCAHAAQHLTVWHTAKRDRDTDRAPKRVESLVAVMAAAAQMAMHLCLAITGPLWQPVRRMSPVLVVA